MHAIWLSIACKLITRQVDIPDDCNRLLIGMEQVALKKFIDDISVLAVERCLISKLPGLFDPGVVHALTDEDITRLAGESEDNAALRARYQEKWDILGHALANLKRLDKHSSAFGDGDETEIDENQFNKE